MNGSPGDSAKLVPFFPPLLSRDGILGGPVYTMESDSVSGLHVLWMMQSSCWVGGFI